MPQGLQIWDTAGNLVLDTNTFTGFILGRVDIGAGNQSGNVTDVRFANGSPFYFVAAQYGATMATPTVTFSGTTMTWAASGYGTYAGAIFYGVR